MFCAHPSTVFPMLSISVTGTAISRRFRAVEAGAKEAGRSLKDMTLAEMDALWEAAKKDES